MKSLHQQNDIEKDRDKFIGGSDLPYILGKGTYKYGKSIIKFAKEKLGLMPKDGPNEYTTYGHLMEPAIRNYINSVFGLNFIEDSVVNSEKSYRANCDGIDRENNLLLEVKTYSKRLDVNYYTPQCQFYMELFNIDTCYLVGYERPENFFKGILYELSHEEKDFDLSFDESRVRIYKLERDKELFEKYEIEIGHFKYLLKCLKEEAILNGRKFSDK